MKSEEDEDEKVAASALSEVSYCLKTALITFYIYT